MPVSNETTVTPPTRADEQFINRQAALVVSALPHDTDQANRVLQRAMALLAFMDDDDCRAAG